MLALLGAVREELAGMHKRMAVDETLAQDGWRLFAGKYAGTPALLVQTGVGKERAEGAARFVLEHYPVTILFSFGFAGALSEELQVGDLVLCRKLYRESKTATGDACYSDTNLLLLVARTLTAHAQEQTAVRVSLGSNLTVNRLAASTMEKQALAGAFRAHVVDMESYWVARIAAARQIPFVAVRAVSDTLGQSLPPLGRFLSSDSEWLWTEMLVHFLAHPEDLTKLPWIYMNARRARNSLTAFCDALIVEPQIFTDPVGLKSSGLETHWLQ